VSRRRPHPLSPRGIAELEALADAHLAALVEEVKRDLRRTPAERLAAFRRRCGEIADAMTTLHAEGLDVLDDDDLAELARARVGDA